MKEAFLAWFFHQESSAHTDEHGGHAAAPWYATLWLTGVDYFSSLGYAPWLAVMSAGYLAPLATVALVAVTLLVAVPMYFMVAKFSPNGEGSVKMIEELTSGWGRLGWIGKLIVLALLGGAMQGFVITVTLSAADAAQHIIENPMMSPYVPHNGMFIAAALILALGAVFLKGFKEAIGIAVVIAVPYMVMNGIIVGMAVAELLAQPDLFLNWWVQALNFSAESLQQDLRIMDPHAVVQNVGSGIMALIMTIAIIFPKLALGMSGFETGVAVMPNIRAHGLEERITNARKLLLSAALLMSVMLLGANTAATLLIPRHLFAEGGEASGRALSYLAHTRLGDTFGNVYDINTVLILWFAGASAMAGLLNLIPRYLPRFGMSPAFLELQRPMIVTLTGIMLLVNWVFDGDVDAQAGAYALGVLMLMTSGAFAVFLAMRKTAAALPFGVALLIFLYVTAANAYAFPDGICVYGIFVAGIVTASIWSRTRRAYELRVQHLIFDGTDSEALWNELKATEKVVIIPQHRMSAESRAASRALRYANGSKKVFLHVHLVQDTSAFSAPLRVKVSREDEYYIIEVFDGVAIANVIAFVALELKATKIIIGLLDNGTPLVNAALYLLFGTGEVGYGVRAIFLKFREEAFRAAQQLLEEKRRQAATAEKAVLRRSFSLDNAARHRLAEDVGEQETACLDHAMAAVPHFPEIVMIQD